MIKTIKWVLFVLFYVPVCLVLVIALLIGAALVLGLFVQLPSTNLPTTIKIVACGVYILLLILMIYLCKLTFTVIFLPFIALKRSIFGPHEKTQIPNQGYCANCGIKLTSEMNFCASCGTPSLKESAEKSNSIDGAKYLGDYQGAAGAAYFVGGLTFIVSLVSALNNDFLGLGLEMYNTIIFGLGFLVLAIFIQRKSLIAITLAIIFYGWDTLTVISMLLKGNSFAVGFLIMHVIFFISFLKGFDAIRALKKIKKTIPQPEQASTKENTLPEQPSTKRLNKSQVISLATISIVLVVICFASLRMRIWSLTDIPYQVKNITDEVITKIRPEPVSMGMYNGSNYSNSFFGISYTLPKNMVIATSDEISGYYKDVISDKAILFTFASKYPLKSKSQHNANFQFGCEKLPAFLAPSAQEYFETVKKQLKDTDASYTFSETVKFPIDGVEFTAIGAKQTAASQDIYLAKRNGYFIFFTLSYDSATDKKMLNDILSTVRFTASTEEDWVVDSFKSDISIDKSGEVKVTETITVDFKKLAKHGIYRDLPIAPQSTGSKTPLDITLIKVLQNNREIEHQTSSDGNNLKITIGDPEVTISGKNTYQIEYLVRGALKGIAGYDQLSWNVTGNNLAVPIKSAEAQVTLPENGITKVSCFQGHPGSTNDCTASIKSPLSAHFKSVGTLESSAGMTIVVDYTKGLVPLLKAK